VLGYLSLKYHDPLRFDDILGMLLGIKKRAEGMPID
jgi:hypothetical protein